MAHLLVITEQTTIPTLRMIGQDAAADELIASTTQVVNDPENAEAVKLARAQGFRWAEE